MNEKDLQIISELRKNARETLTKMSRKTHIPVSSIYERLKNQENTIIIKHTTLLDFSKLGFNTRATIVIKAEREHKNELKEYLEKHQNVNSLFKINNGFDFLIDGIFRHLKDLEDFLDCLENKFNVHEKQVYYLIDEIKRETFLMDPVMSKFVLN